MIGRAAPAPVRGHCRRVVGRPRRALPVCPGAQWRPPAPPALTAPRSADMPARKFIINATDKAFQLQRQEHT